MNYSTLFLAACMAAAPVLAQDVLALAPSAAPETVYVPKDTVFLSRPSGHPPKLDLELLTSKRDQFERMQKNGFGLIMGGIAAAAGGITLMVIGISQNEAANNDPDPYDPYGDDNSSSDGLGLVIVGYISVLASPALITPGIILNRIGNSKRQRYQMQIDEYGRKVRVDVGVNSFRVSYSF